MFVSSKFKVQSSKFRVKVKVTQFNVHSSKFRVRVKGKVKGKDKVKGGSKFRVWGDGFNVVNDVMEQVIYVRSVRHRLYLP